MMELKACPFCGGAAYFARLSGSHGGVKCRKCNAGTTLYDSPERAIAAWNSRPDDQQSQATERLRAACQFLETVAESDWTDIDLSQAAVNVRHARGSLDRETRRTAASAIRTLQAILKDARALSVTEPSAEGGAP